MLQFLNTKFDWSKSDSPCDERVDLDLEKNCPKSQCNSIKITKACHVKNLILTVKSICHRFVLEKNKKKVPVRFIHLLHIAIQQ